MSAPVDVLAVMPSEWMVRVCANGSSVSVCESRYGATIALLKADHPVTKGRKKENADRIVACVNAMDGVADPAVYRAAVAELIEAGSGLASCDGMEDAPVGSPLARFLTALARVKGATA